MLATFLHVKCIIIHLMTKRLPPRGCLTCARTFTPKRTWQHFCSKACRESSHKTQQLAEYTCVYCGLVAATVDHIPPRTVRPSLIALGYQDLYPFIEVRACLECNSTLSDRPLWDVQSRKDHIKDRLKRKYKRYLELPDWSPDDLAEMGYKMRLHITQGLAIRAVTRARISY